ncbi:50S ribosomal protein L20 [Atribacter laminatus]|uniref:Large ribosomal subunit protein bL20 n=1 Tax=Atribacter laminatus TaxID=2847778 RepID=A0A7T1F3L7_ATRLM|nr:50S ribosomal protein L20 [Atribacter laminatus]QPM69248.1 50S ribosomal protein L20 [Atribacter laminatus]
MPRVKNSVASRQRKKKIMKLASGYRGSRSRSYRRANEQVLKSQFYAYRDRKNKKRDFRRLWIVRINAAVREHGLKYNQFMFALKKAGIVIDRKNLSNIAITDPVAFAHLVEVAKSAT